MDILTWVMVVLCVIQAILSALGIWKANRGGVTSLWLLLGFMSYMFGELTEMYKELVIMLK